MCSGRVLERAVVRAARLLPFLVGPNINTKTPLNEYLVAHVHHCYTTTAITLRHY
jgi:hypothetical protein